ncbi:MAG: OmpA family protein [bacterium]|nr:OmpA family protein [bacterium]
MAREENAYGGAVPRTVFWLLAIWVLVVLAALVWGIEHAETTLRTDARDSLNEDGHNVAVDFSGRDARLIGSVASEEHATEIAESIDALPGVRRVEIDLDVIEPPPPVVQPPEVTFRIVGDAVSIRGAVPTADVEATLVEAAEKQYGADRVINALVVSEGVPEAAWLGRIRDVFPQIGKLRSGGFTATDDGFTISGDVISEAVREEMLGEIDLVLADALPVRTEITIAVLPSPTFTASGSSGLVRLAGSLPNQETVDQIAEAAGRLHEGETIVNGLRVNEVAGPEWLELIDGLLDVVTRLDSWTLEVADGVVTITGMALDEDRAAAVDVLASQVTEDQLVVIADVQINPAAVAIQLTNLLQGTATFESNQAELSESGVAQLNAAIGILDANPTAVVVIQGYTDNEGDPAANLELSQQRAEAVLVFLVEGGIDPSRLSVIGLGEADPVADNSTEEGRALNRRIVFVMQEGDS